jgi:TRAP-type C4-dicarboxylate transport system permease small subunit
MMQEKLERHLSTFLTCAPFLYVGIMMLIAPDANAQVSRVTQELEATQREVAKWTTIAQAIFSGLAGVIACYVGYQWWAERGQGKESAKGLVMGIVFALALAPWFIDCASGCSGRTPGN